MGKGQEVTKNIINHLEFMIVNTKSTNQIILFSKYIVTDQSVGKRQFRLMLALNKRSEVTKNH